MLEIIMFQRNVKQKNQITVKAITSICLIALAVILPQIVHLILGQQGGIQLLPMYLPVLIGGCLLGWRWAIPVGALAPFVSFILTSFLGAAMPSLQRLPFMIAELIVFALVSGLFSKKIYNNGLWAFFAVILAQLLGRSMFLVLALIFLNVVPFTVPMVFSQILSGWIGLTIQALLVPLLINGLRTILVRNND